MILIYDNSGKLLKSNIDVQESNSFDFTELPAGMYILKIKVGEHKSEWKIIKE